MSANAISLIIPSNMADTAEQAVQSVIRALNKNEISEAVGQFADQFIFTDHALGLEFAKKERLTEFFSRSHDLFPNAVMKVVSIFQSEGSAVAEWELTATQVESYGSFHYRVPICLRGVSIVRVQNGKITRWSDFYDQLTSRRFALIALFKEWIEY